MYRSLPSQGAIVGQDHAWHQGVVLRSMNLHGRMTPEALEQRGHLALTRGEAGSLDHGGRVPLMANVADKVPRLAAHIIGGWLTTKMTGRFTLGLAVAQGCSANQAAGLLFS